LLYVVKIVIQLSAEVSGLLIVKYSDQFSFMTGCFRKLCSFNIYFT